MQVRQEFNRRRTEDHIMLLWDTYSGFYRWCKREYENLILKVRAAGMRPCMKVDKHIFVALRSCPFLSISSELEARKRIQEMDDKSLRGLEKRLEAFKNDVYHLRVRDAIWELQRQLRRKGDWKIYCKIDQPGAEDEDFDD